MYDLVDAYEWRQEQPESVVWLFAQWLQAKGCEIPWTPRTLLGRPEYQKKKTADG